MNKEGDEMEYPKFSVLMSLYIKEKAEYYKTVGVQLFVALVPKKIRLFVFTKMLRK